MDDLLFGLSQLQAAKYEYISDHTCDWSENPRPFSTIAVMQKGNGKFMMDDNTIDVGKFDVFFIPVGAKYISYWSGPDGILYYAIHFHITNPHSEFSPQRFCLQKIQSLQTKSLLSKFELLCRYILEGGMAKLKAYSLFYDLYSKILPFLKYEKVQNISISRIKPAVEYIERNSDREFSISDLAQICLLSESRLYALFKKTMRCSPITYRNSIRIQKAVNLLENDYTIEEIATKLGFSSAVYFRRVFKEIMGKLPSEYRRNLKFNIDLSTKY